MPTDAGYTTSRCRMGIRYKQSIVYKLCLSSMEKNLSLFWNFFFLPRSDSATIITMYISITDDLDASLLDHINFGILFSVTT